MRTDDRARLVRRRPALEARARVLSSVRRWFEREGFLEVDTPARVRAPGQEVHLDALPSGDRWLITSPEYAMKRLCGAGYEKIVSIGKCWRAEERGPHHEPEFTMIEWYRAHAPLEQLAADCEALLRVAAEALPVVPPAQPYRRTTVRAIVHDLSGVDIEGDETSTQLATKIRAAGFDPGRSQAWDDLFFQLWLDRVEPKLAALGPLFIFDWPTPLGALARRKPDDPRLVERFELYANGLELANAFGELTDPTEQRARFLAETEARRSLGKATYPLDEPLLAALPTMPPTSGIALGFDRLLMLLLGTSEIRDVQAFASDEI
jgi:elongation factor P--(R)-beta-lysine ligase